MGPSIPDPVYVPVSIPEHLIDPRALFLLAVFFQVLYVNIMAALQQ